jgi:hypothetical protein
VLRPKVTWAEQRVCVIGGLPGDGVSGPRVLGVNLGEGTVAKKAQERVRSSGRPVSKRLSILVKVDAAASRGLAGLCCLLTSHGARPPVSTVFAFPDPGRCHEWTAQNSAQAPLGKKSAPALASG